MTTRKLILHVCLSFILFVNSSCIHTRSDETKEIKETTASELTQLQADSLEINYLIYRPSQLPLSEFFSNLKSGEYKEAFKKIDIRYKPANHDDQIMGELINAGFVPVYVKIRNNGNQSIEINEKSFSIETTEGSVKAYSSDHLPRKFKELSPSAIAANVYNTGVVIVGFAAVLGVLMVIHRAGTPQFDSNDNSTPSNQNEIYNDVYKNVRIDYKNYLISQAKLEPGKKAKGLLFFDLEKTRLAKNPELFFN